MKISKSHTFLLVAALVFALGYLVSGGISVDESGAYTAEVAALSAGGNYFESGFITPASCGTQIRCTRSRPCNGGQETGFAVVGRAYHSQFGNACSQTCWDGSVIDSPSQSCPARPAPVATISDVPDPTWAGQAFTVSYGRSGGGTASSCTLQLMPPGGSFSTVHTNSGGTSNVSQTLSSPLGVWTYRARCSGPGGNSPWVSANHTLTPPPQCRDGNDNEGDTLIDAGDPGCYDSGVFNPNDDNETDSLPISGDNFDNDGDTLVDNADPELDISITASPTLVQQGDTSSVSWTGTGVCTVTGPTGVLDSFNTGTGHPGTGSASPVIQGESIFTIDCNFIGTAPNTASARVIVIPSFQEF